MRASTVGKFAHGRGIDILLESAAHTLRRTCGSIPQVCPLSETATTFSVTTLNVACYSSGTGKPGCARHAERFQHRRHTTITHELTFHSYLSESRGGPGPTWFSEGGWAGGGGGEWSEPGTWVTLKPGTWVTLLLCGTEVDRAVEGNDAHA